MERYYFHGLVTDVYDGDSLTADISVGFGVVLKGVKLRLAGVDTPEIRGGTDLTKAAARKSRDYVRELVLDKTIGIHSVKKGKYGRFIARIWVLEEEKPLSESVNDELIRLGLATAYGA